MTWHSVKEIRIRHHQKVDRPACLMVIFELDGHSDVFDFLAFDSPKAFAVEKAGSRWLELCGEEPVPTSTAEAYEREAELCCPKRVFLSQDGDWIRVSEVSFEEAKDSVPDPSLEKDRAYLEETTEPKISYGFDFSKRRS